MTKVLIVGGGVAGLTAGIYARNAGYEAEIYEKNPLPGGECTGWDREGYHIDNCIHWLMGTSPGTALHEIWRTTGALGDSVEVYKANKMYTSELNGQRISLWHSIDQTEHDLLRLSPDDAAENHHADEELPLVPAGYHSRRKASRILQRAGPIEDGREHARRAEDFQDL